MPRYGWLTLALVLTLAVETCVALRSPAISPDGVTFIEIARELRRAPLAVMRAQDQHPGYSALIVGAHALLTAGDQRDSTRPDAAAWILAGQFVAMVAGLGCVVLCWLIARRMYDHRIANIAALIAAGLPALRQNAADVLSDTPHLCVYLLAAWCLQVGLERASKSWLLAAGMASGCAFWIRPEGLSVAIVGGLYLFTAFCASKSPRRQLTTQALALVCGAAIITAPYVLATGKLTSKKDPLATVQKPAAFAMPLVNTPAAESIAATPNVRVAPAIVVSPPPSGSWSSRLVDALEKYFVELGYGFGYVMWIPWGFGTFAGSRPTPQGSSLRLLASLALFHSLLLIWLAMTAGYLGHRHVMPIIAVAIPATAAGIEWFGQRLGQLLHRPEYSPQFSFATMLTLVAIALPFSTRPNNSVAAPVVEAADWVRDASSEGQTLLANSRYPHLYAELDGPIFGIDVTDLDHGLRTLRPDFVLLDVDTRRYAPPRPEELGPDYAPAFAAQGAGERAWHRVLVYRRTSPREPAPQLQASGGQDLR